MDFAIAIRAITKNAHLAHIVVTYVDISKTVIGCIHHAHHFYTEVLSISNISARIYLTFLNT